MGQRRGGKLGARQKHCGSHQSRGFALLSSSQAASHMGVAGIKQLPAQRLRGGAEAEFVP